MQQEVPAFMPQPVYALQHTTTGTMHQPVKQLLGESQKRPPAASCVCMLPQGAMCAAGASSLRPWWQPPLLAPQHGIVSCHGSAALLTANKGGRGSCIAAGAVCDLCDTCTYISC